MCAIISAKCMSNSKRRSDSEGVDESFSDGHHIVIEIICAKCMEDPGGQIMSNSKRRSDSEGVDESFWDGHRIVIEIICAKCME